MTALDTAAPAGRRLGNRTLNVVRLHLISARSFVWVPLLILAAAAAFSVIIFLMIPGDGVKTAGAANAPLWYFFALGLQAMTLTFPFSQALSVTRKEFFIGTMLAGVLGSAMMATLFIVMAAIEVVTDGYGVNGRVAYLEWLFEPGWVSAWLSYFAFTLLLFVIGFWSATIYKRFGTFTIVATGVGVGLFNTAVIFVITRTNSWPAVLAWFDSITGLGVALIGLALTAVLALGAYATLRKAVPA